MKSNGRLLSRLGIWVGGAMLAFPLWAHAQSLTVQGRLLNSNREPLINTDVEMRVQVYTDTAPRCALYEEVHEHIDLSDSLGLFSINLNSGAYTGSAPLGFTFENALSNLKTMNVPGANCPGGVPTVYSPGPTSTRKISIAFRPTPGASFEEIPDLDLSPSAYAMEARTVGGFPASSVLRVADTLIAGQPVPNSAPILTAAEATELKLLAGGNSGKYVAVSGSGVAQVPAPTTPPSVTPPVGSMWFDSATGKIKYVDGGGVQTVGTATGGGAPSGAAGGDLYGTYPNPGVGKIQGRGVAGAAPLDGQVFRYDAGSVNLWTPSYLSIGDLKTPLGAPQFGSASCAAGSTLTWSSVTDTFSSTSISITKSQVSDFPTLGTAAALNSGTAAGNVPVLDAGGKILASVLPASAASPWLNGTLGELYYSGSNVGIGTSSPGAPLDVRGAIRLSGATSGYTGFQPAANAGSTVWTLPSADGVANQVLKTDGAGNLGWYTPAGAGISTINGTAPLVASTSSGTTTLSMPAASASADGYLTSASWTAFNNKLSAVVGSALSSANIWVGNGSNQAASVPLTGDATLSSAGALTVTKLQGRAVANTAPTDGNVLKYINASNEWQPGSLSIGDLKTSLGASQFASATCAANSTLVWSSVTDTFSCQAISVTKAQVSDFPALGTASALNAGTAAGNVPVLDAGGKILTSVLPSGSATQWVDAGSGNIYYSGGNVGIGVASPSSKLHVSDANRTDTATSTQFSSQFLTSLRPTADSDTSITGTRMQLDTQSGVAINHTNILAASTSRANYNGTGTASYVYGSYGISSNASSGTISTSRGAYNRSVNIGTGSMGISSGAFNLSDNTGAGTITSSYGSYSISSNGDSGSIANSFGSYGRVHNVSNGGITSAFGHRSQIYNESTGTIGSAYGAYVELLNASGTVNNWYGLYIADAGTSPSYYSLYTSGTTKSYFGGNVGFGVNLPATAVDINGALSHRGIATASAPAVAPSSQGRIYYDSTLNQYMVSQNGGAYVPLSTNGSSSQTFSGPVTMNGAGTSLAVTNNQTVGGTLSVGGATSVTDTTAATSSTTGAMKVAGGLGVAGDIFAGASVNASTLMRTPQIYGSSSASGTLRLDGTSHGTKGSVLLNSAGGNVGVGTTAPTNVFEVVNTAASANAMAIRSNPGGSSPGVYNRLLLDNTYGAGNFKNGIQFASAGASKWTLGNDLSGNGTQNFFLYDGAALATRLLVDSEGNVGIGTAAPGQLLHLYKAAGNDTKIHLAQGTSNWALGMDASSSNFRITAGSSSVAITPAANVGIGTTTPTTKLDVRGNALIDSGVVDSGIVELGLGSLGTGAQVKTKILANAIGSWGRHDLHFVLDSINDAGSADINDSKMMIKNNGYVGIGTAAPLARLDVQHSAHGLPATSGTVDAAIASRIGAAPAGTNVTMDMGVQGGTGDAWIQSRSRADFALNYKLLLNPNGGNVGIGTTAPRATLDVNGAVVGKAATPNGFTTINFSSGNMQYTALNCQAFSLHNLKDGGSYMFAVQGTTQGTCSFTAFSDAGSTALTMHLPMGHGATMAGKHTVYNFAVLGTHVYASWMPGY